MLNIILSHFQFSILISIPFSNHPAFYKVSEAVACQLLPGIG